MTSIVRFGIIPVNPTNMPVKDIIKAFQKYQKAHPKKRAKYMSAFEEQMIYRTTKTENPETTLRMVRQVLRKFPSV